MCTTHGQAILLLHEIYGINEFIHSVRKKLEQRGFDVLCPNMTAIQPFAYEERQKAYKYFMAHVGFDIYRDIGARIR